MTSQSLLYRSTYEINKHISIMLPPVGDIIDHEDEYYTLVFLLTAMPIDLMVQLDDIGIDFTKINEFELFTLLFGDIKEQDTSLIFGDLDLSKFELGINEDNGLVCFIDTENDIKIDRALYNDIANALRRIHHLEKDKRKPANEEAKEYMIRRAREKLKRRKNRKHGSQLEPLITAMVNTEQYKYDFEGTRELSIYQFNECVRQIIKKVDYDNRMHGVYAGTISINDLSKDDLTWIQNNK